MTGPTPDPATPVNQVTMNNDDTNESPSLQDQILDQMSSLKALIKQHNERSRAMIRPIRLSVDDEDGGGKGKGIDRSFGDEKDEDLWKPYKEDVPANSTRSGKGLVRSVTKWANETPPDFKERWIEEISYILDFPKVMQISAFMSNSKCPELARRFSDQVPRTVTKMMRRVDDFVKSEEDYKSTELPKGEHPEKGQGTPYQGSRQPRMTYGAAKGNNGHSTPATASMSTDDQNTEEGNMDRYYDNHGEKGHYTNDCYQLKRQQEAA
ncbi:hypothetical protein Tco_1380614 [Tanacetum coccineum]